MIMRSMSVAALALVVFVSLPARAQQAPQKIDVSRLGPLAGQAVPDFRLQDAQGNAKTLAAAKRIETDHLEITSYVSDEVVAPWSLFSVVLDVKPNAGIHVSRPGRRTTRSSTSGSTPIRF